MDLFKNLPKECETKLICKKNTYVVKFNPIIEESSAGIKIGGKVESHTVNSMRILPDFIICIRTFPTNKKKSIVHTDATAIALQNLMETVFI
jgi:hypothetical protein